jgi:D-3-phosphoglycerate dehydrogenase
MKVLIADKLESFAVTELQKICSEVVMDPSLKGDALAEASAGADILVVRSTEVPSKVFERSRRLALVVRAGAGVNTIDVKAAAARGVFVANCPGKNATAVAELALGLLVAIDRRIPDNVAALRAGRWDKKTFSEARGLAGRTIGIVGLGQIGRELLKRVQAFGMRTLVWSRSLTQAAAEDLGVERAASLEALLREADVVSLHLALTPETRGILSRERIGLLKPGAVLLNTARAELVDEEALLDAVRERGIRVGVDVLAGEPEVKAGEFRSALADHPNVYVTHHIGASTEQAQNAVAEETVRIVRSFLETGVVPNCVNLCARSPATHQLAVRHEDRVGVLAGVLGEISRHGLNVEEMENVIFDGAQAACCFIRLASEPRSELLLALEKQPHVLGIGVQRLGGAC